MHEMVDRATMATSNATGMTLPPIADMPSASSLAMPSHALTAWPKTAPDAASTARK